MAPRSPFAFCHSLPLVISRTLVALADATLDVDVRSAWMLHYAEDVARGPVKAGRRGDASAARAPPCNFCAFSAAALTGRTAPPAWRCLLVGLYRHARETSQTPPNNGDAPPTTVPYRCCLPPYLSPWTLPTRYHSTRHDARRAFIFRCWRTLVDILRRCTYHAIFSPRRTGRTGSFCRHRWRADRRAALLPIASSPTATPKRQLYLSLHLPCCCSSRVRNIARLSCYDLRLDLLPDDALGKHALSIAEPRQP